jgi:L-gulonolactone oxidase
VWTANRTTLPPTPKPSALRAAVDKAVGYHALEAALELSRGAPALVPGINKLFQSLLFEAKKERVDDSVSIFNFDCLFKQFVDEWAVPIERTADALRAIRALILKENFNAHFPIEVRFVAQDSILLSPARDRAVCYIGVIMYRPYGRSVPYERYFEGYERIMAAMGGRPHWAKATLICDSKFFENAYGGGWVEFKKLREKLDPSGLFLNSWARRVFDL